MISKYLKYLVSTAEKNYLSNLIRILKSKQLHVDRFVDIGCYTGENTLDFAHSCKAKFIYGTDSNIKALKISSKKGIKTIYQNLSESRWNIETNKFDFVYSNQVIEHLYSVDNFILNIKRILKNNGYALISTENLAGWHNIFSLLLGFQPFSLTNICTKKWSIGNPMSINKEGHNDPYMIHRAVFTFYTLIQFLKLYKFEIVDSITSGYYPFPNNSFGNIMAKIDKNHSVYISVFVKNHK